MALLLGYMTAALWQSALARALPMARIDATITATMASFAVYAGAAIWAFAARSMTGAAIGLVTAGLVAAGILMVPL